MTHARLHAENNSDILHSPPEDTIVFPKCKQLAVFDEYLFSPTPAGVKPDYETNSEARGVITAEEQVFEEPQLPPEEPVVDETRSRVNRPVCPPEWTKLVYCLQYTCQQRRYPVAHQVSSNL
jgi:hypothetical protein